MPPSRKNLSVFYLQGSRPNRYRYRYRYRTQQIEINCCAHEVARNDECKGGGDTDPDTDSDTDGGAMEP
jgi:hypothetical protein